MGFRCWLDQSRCLSSAHLSHPCLISGMGRSAEVQGGWYTKNMLVSQSSWVGGKWGTLSSCCSRKREERAGAVFTSDMQLPSSVLLNDTILVQAYLPRKWSKAILPKPSSGVTIWKQTGVDWDMYVHPSPNVPSTGCQSGLDSLPVQLNSPSVILWSEVLPYLGSNLGSTASVSR